MPSDGTVAQDLLEDIGLTAEQVEAMYRLLVYHLHAIGGFLTRRGAVAAQSPTPAAVRDAARRPLSSGR